MSGNDWGHIVLIGLFIIIGLVCVARAGTAGKRGKRDDQ